PPLEVAPGGSRSAFEKRACRLEVGTTRRSRGESGRTFRSPTGSERSGTLASRADGKGAGTHGRGSRCARRSSRRRPERRIDLANPWITRVRARSCCTCRGGFDPLAREESQLGGGSPRAHRLVCDSGAKRRPRGSVSGDGENARA